MLKEDVVCEPAAMDSEDILFLLYTSGSTGKPKGLVHTQAGYLLYAALTHRVSSNPTNTNRLLISLYNVTLNLSPPSGSCPVRLRLP